MAGRAVALGAVLVFLFVGATAISAQHSTSAREVGEETLIENETWDVDPGNITYLANSNLSESVYAESVDVYQNGTRFAEDGNYTWFVKNGSVKATQGTGLNASQDANITYAFYEPTGEQQILVAIGTLPVSVGFDVLMILMVALVMLSFAVFIGRGM